MDIKEKVYNAMKKANKEMRTGEIADLAEVDKKEAEKAINSLNAEARIFSPKRCFWKVK